MFCQLGQKLEGGRITIVVSRATLVAIIVDPGGKSMETPC